MERLALLDRQAFTQQGSSFFDWLASLQAIEARLQANGGASLAAPSCVRCRYRF
jgi:hypothetical protein